MATFDWVSGICTTCTDNRPATNLRACMYFFVYASRLRSMLRSLHESINISHDPETQYRNIAPVQKNRTWACLSFWKWLPIGVHVAFLKTALSNSGARSAEVAESCRSVAVGCRILLNLRTRGDSETTAVRFYVICKKPDRVKARS